MNKDNDYYRALDLRSLAREIPHDKETRRQAEAFHDLLIALALRCGSEAFSGSDMRDYLGEPDLVKRTEQGEVWQYSWRDEHCSREYRSWTPFVLRDGRVVGVARDALASATK